MSMKLGLKKPIILLVGLGIAAIGAGFSLAPRSAQAAGDDAKLEELMREVARLQARVSRQEDVESIRRIAYAYGYFMDNALTDEVKAMFAREMDYCEVSGYGLYKGRKGCDTMWTSVVGVGLQDDNGHLAFGRIAKHYLVKDMIDVASDGRSAQGRFDYFAFGGTFGKPERTRHQLGVYRMGFIKEDGVWKINRFSLVFDAIDYDFDEWANKPGMRCPPPQVPPPDAPFTYYHPFPETGVIPFHFPNPVTGKPIREYVNPTRYWEGNWPGEFKKVCGVRADAPKQAAPTNSRRGSTPSAR